MIEHTVSVYIDRPVHQVFAFLADQKNLRSWQSNLIESQQLTPGPVQVGTNFREVRQTGPRQSEVKAVVTEFDETNNRFRIKTISEPEVNILYVLESEAGGTRIDYQFVMLNRGIMRFFEPLLAGSIKKETDLDFQRLKQLLESR